MPTASSRSTATLQRSSTSRCCRSCSNPSPPTAATSRTTTCIRLRTRSPRCVTTCGRHWPRCSTRRSPRNPCRSGGSRDLFPYCPHARRYAGPVCEPSSPLPVLRASERGRGFRRSCDAVVVPGSGLAAQQRVGIDRGALPPLLLRPQREDREVQVRRLGAGVAGAADVADHVARPDLLLLVQLRRVRVQVRVVVGVPARRFELVDRQPAAV